MNFEALITYINSTPLTWLIVTLLSFKIGIIIYEKFNKHTLLQPIIIAYILIMSLIVLTETSFEQYFKSVEIIHFFLGPATVALALPLYNNLKYIKSLFVPIVVTLFVAGVFSILIAVVLLWIFGAELPTILSMTTKSITAPIAIITSEQIGAIPSLAVGFVLITGMIGALLGTIVFKLVKVKYETSKGFALGLVSHGIGTARAIEIGEKAAAFSALAMGLSGIFTAIFLPLIITFFTK
ncbi:LrgB family protein [Poseidonibacter sp.]|uniref:LrgB family protein n=1 Tax=Poseidonibacter sp. TaxID=2321188 RepID=UPI003C76F260